MLGITYAPSKISVRTFNFTLSLRPRVRSIRSYLLKKKDLLGIQSCYGWGVFGEVNKMRLKLDVHLKQHLNIRL